MNGVGRCRCMCDTDDEAPVSVHRPACFAICAEDAEGQIIDEKIVALKNDKDMVRNGSQLFIKTLIEQEEFYKSYLFDDTTLPPNAMDLKRYLNSTHCYLCE